MRISFSWVQISDEISPFCYSSRSDISPLACLLMDDGGMGYKRTIPWLDEGLRRLKAVKNQEVSLCDWAREGWGAEINSFQVKIYSLNDEDFFEIINILDFEKILKFWKNFIEAEPILGQEEALDIES